MGIVTRTISKQFLSQFSGAIVILLALNLFQALITQWGDYTALQFFIYYGYDLPKLVVQAAGPAAMMGVLLSLSGFNRTNELTAFRSIGYGIPQISRLIILWCIGLGLLLLAVQNWILPYFYEKQMLFYWREMRERKEYALGIQRDRIWYRSGRYIYSISGYSKKEELLRDVRIFQLDPQFRLVQLLEAPEARYKKDHWELINGYKTSFSQPDYRPVTERFKTEAAALREGPIEFQELEKETDRLRLTDLRRFIGRHKASGIKTIEFEMKYYMKLAQCVVPLIMALLAIPYSMRRTREGGAGKDYALCFMWIVFYWVVLSVCGSLGFKETLDPWFAAWLPSLVFLLIAGFLIHRMKKSH